MSVLQRFPIIRWAVPAVAVATIAAVSAIPLAGADPTLPPKTAEELLVDLQSADVDEFSGTVTSSTDLGLPPLPVDGSDFTALLSGSHTVRVWQSGDDKSRVALIGDGSETVVVRNGQDLWQWSSESATATHVALPEHYAADHPNRTDMPTPQEAAEQLLEAIEPTTEVSVTTSERVAGRPAYVLVLDPDSDTTLVDRATIAVDSETSAPLRVQIYATSSADPAVSVGFTDVDFTAPDDALFDFTPPSGATVEEVTPDKSGDHAKPDDLAEPVSVGAGWDRVMVLELPEGQRPADSSGSEDGADLQALLNQLPTVQGDWGTGKLLTSSLFSVVLTSDGRVAVGMVPGDHLVAAIPR